MAEFASALSVQGGIEQPASVSPYFVPRRAKKLLTAEEYVAGIVGGNRVLLSQAITLIESANPSHFPLAQSIIEQCLPHANASIRIGITGVPGVGKSTFIERFGKLITNEGHKLAVLAIDPSSERSKGSILGDKTRMEQLSTDPNAFIRPTPSGLTLGGVARKTRETMVLCEAAGFDVIIIETVGVGQSETVVKSMVDFFLLLMLAGAGDELQGIKRGIMEMADSLVITKADGDNLAKANAAKAQYQSALHLFPPNDNGWMPPVKICSALANSDIDTVWQMIRDFERFTKENGSFQARRNEQMATTFFEWMESSLKSTFYANSNVQSEISRLLPSIKAGKISPYQAGSELLNLYQKS